MTRRFDRAERPLATRLGLVAVVATLALWTSLAWAEPAAPTDARAGNHPGFGRLVFDFATRTAYQQVREGDHLSLRFATDVTITAPARLPHNVDAFDAQPGVVDLVVMASATTHVFWLGTRLVVDVYDAAGTATAPPGQAVPPTRVPLATAAPTLALLTEAALTEAELAQAELAQAVPTQALPTQAVPIQALLTQAAPTQAAPTLAPRTLGPPSGNAAMVLPTAGAAAQPAPADAPEQAAVASLPLPPPPAPPAPPASPAAATAAHDDRTVVPAMQTVSASATSPTEPSRRQPIPAGTPPGTPARQAASAPGQSGQRAQAAAQLPGHAAVQPPNHAAVQPPDHAATQPAPQLAVQPPDHAAVQPAPQVVVRPAPQVAVQPPDHGTVQPPNQAAIQPPAPPPAPVAGEATAAAGPPAVEVDPIAAADVPAGPFAPLADTADPPQRIGMVLALPFPTSVGVAAFRRGDTALVVFDERRPIDLAAVQDDPVFGTATVELLAEATVLRLRLADRELAIGETQHTWHVGVVASAAPARPIPMQVADGRVRLPADAVGAVVAIPDPGSGATLLVGTQRTTGQGFSTLRQTPEFSILPTWQGIAVEPLADSLVLRAGNDGFLLTGGNHGLAISLSSTAMQAQTDASAMTRRFDLRNQPLETLQRRLRSQVLAAAMAPPRARGAPRQRAAETMIAMGLGAEAQAMLQLAATDDPAAGATAAGTGLGAIAALLAGRIEDADGIEDPRLTGSDEVTLWRAVRTAEKAHGSPLAATAFAVTTPLIAIYPAALRKRLLPLAFETMIEGGQTAAAARLLAHEPDNDPTLALARGMLRAASGDTDGALTIYDKLANDPDRLLHAKAAVRAVELRLSAGRLDAAQAADALDRLLYSWRGGRRELELRERIAGLREQSGDWTAALAMLHETEAVFPDDTEAVHARLKAAFTRLLQNKALDRLAPLELVSMVEENSGLLPSGPAGEALEERLADRLLALDLPQRAGPVLEKLMLAAPSWPGGPGSARGSPSCGCTRTTPKARWRRWPRPPPQRCPRGQPFLRRPPRRPPCPSPTPLPGALP